MKPTVASSFLNSRTLDNLSNNWAKLISNADLHNFKNKCVYKKKKKKEKQLLLDKYRFVPFILEKNEILNAINI